MHDDTFEIELTTMAHGGSALGRHQNRTVFVPYTIPGEIVRARIVQEKGRIAFAEGVSFVDVSADRVTPRCAYFGPHRCGLCQWQHIDYSAQLLLKQDVLADQLARVGGFDDADVRAVIPAAQQWGYNAHMTLRVQDGKVGFPGTDADTLVQIDECPLIHPDLWALIERLDMDFDKLRSVKVQRGTDGADMLILAVDDEQDLPELSTDIATSVNALLPDNEPVNLIGETHARYEIGGRTFRVTAGSSFRAHVEQLETLAALVVDLLGVGEGDSVLDLYAGVGVFSAFVAPRVSLVTLVESYPPAATDADENLADLDNVGVIEGAVEDVLPELEETYTAAILDPPPDGLSLDVIDLLAEIAIPRLVYVSSDPATLARDAQRLVRHGYTLGAVHPIDLSPQTYYIDSVAVLTR